MEFKKETNTAKAERAIQNNKRTSVLVYRRLADHLAKGRGDVANCSRPEVGQLLDEAGAHLGQRFVRPQRAMDTSGPPQQPKGGRHGFERCAFLL